MNVYEIITQRIIQQLENGIAPWRKPWSTKGSAAIPRNLMTGRGYRGINLWLLVSAGYSSPYWLTFRHALQFGGTIRKGERAVPVVFWRFEERQEVADSVERLKRSVVCRYYNVFNIAQCDDLRIQLADTGGGNTSTILDCEQVISDWLDKSSIQHGFTGASYDKRSDCIRMPFRSAFSSAEEYYSTLFHEAVHSTGHPDRLNRQSLTDFERFGDEHYCREELIAEMGGSYLAGVCGIDDITLPNSAAYMANWIAHLKTDSRAAVIAAAQAQRAVDLIIGAASSADADADSEGMETAEDEMTAHYGRPDSTERLRPSSLDSERESPRVKGRDLLRRRASRALDPLRPEQCGIPKDFPKTVPKMQK